MFESFDLEALLETLSEISMTWGLSVVGAVVVLIVGRIVAGWFRSTVRRVLKRSKVDETLAPFLSNLVYYLIIAFVVIAVLGLFGVPTASFIAVLGAAGLAVGLALQGTLANFAAGVMLLVFRPFRVGDYIDAGGATGTVSENSIFTTTLNTPDNVRITIPNSALSGQTIKTFSANDTRRNDMVFGISYGDDIGKAMQIIQSALEQDERVLQEPSPVIAVGELADSSVNILVRPWCAREDYWGLRFDMTRGLKEKLEAAGCSIPFPQNDVHFFPQGSGTTN
jgi:small conductance mechanosensitive channel